MKFKWIILIVAIIAISLVACDNVFDNNDYVWDNWATALFKN